MSTRLSKLETQLQTDLVNSLSLQVINAVYDITKMVFEFDNPENWSQAYPKPKEIFDIIARAKELFVLCEESVSAHNTENLQKETEVLRADLTAFASSLLLYTMALSPINGYLTDMLEKLDDTSDYSGKKINGTHLVNDCVEFIRNVEKEAEDDLPAYMEEIITCFPLRMTKEKYYDYVRASVCHMLKGVSPENAPGLLQNLKTRFYPTLHPDYGKYFKGILETAEELMARDFSAMNKDELESYQEDTDFCLSDVHEIIDYLNLIYEYLWLIQFMSVIPEPWSIIEDNIVCSDVFRAAAEAVKSGEYEHLADSINDRIETDQGDIFEQILDLREKINAEVEKFGDTPPQDSIVRLILLNEFQEMLALRSLEDEAFTLDFADSQDNLSAEELEKLSDELIRYIIETLSGMPVKTQKIYRAHFMKNLPCLMSITEFSDYLHFSIENSDDGEKIVIALKVLEVLKSTGYSDDEDEECDDPDCGHEHHHH